MDEKEVRKKLVQLTEAGKIIEVGWFGFKTLVLNPAAGMEQVRTAFFAGAQHLFSSMMTIMDPGGEPTERDMKLMEQIHNELEEFKKTIKGLIRSKDENKDETDPNFYGKLTEAARQLNDFFNKKGEKDIGFILLAFQFKDEDDPIPSGDCHILSNGVEVENIITIFKQLSEKFETDPTGPIGHA